jgi:hypothetical protein
MVAITPGKPNIKDPGQKMAIEAEANGNILEFLLIRASQNRRCKNSGNYSSSLIRQALINESRNEYDKDPASIKCGLDTLRSHIFK